MKIKALHQAHARYTSFDGNWDFAEEVTVVGFVSHGVMTQFAAAIYITEAGKFREGYLTEFKFGGKDESI